MTASGCVKENNELRRQLERTQQDLETLTHAAKLVVHDVWRTVPGLPSPAQDSLYKLHDLVWPA